MREILFRGQTRRKGERIKMDGTPVESNWVYGGIFPGDGDFSIIYQQEPTIEKHSVYSDTVGQYTGVLDKNGVKIFEGDIVTIPRYGKGCTMSVVYFRDGKFAVDGSNYAFKDIHGAVTEVIGNIYDNLELIKEYNND